MHIISARCWARRSERVAGFQHGIITVVLPSGTGIHEVKRMRECDCIYVGVGRVVSTLWIRPGRDYGFYQRLNNGTVSCTRRLVHAGVWMRLSLLAGAPNMKLASGVRKYGQFLR